MALADRGGDIIRLNSGDFLHGAAPEARPPKKPVRVAAIVARRLVAFRAFRLGGGRRRRGASWSGPSASSGGFCSWLLSSGASVAAVRLLAGHSDLKTTSRDLHAHDQQLREAITRLG